MSPRLPSHEARLALALAALAGASAAALSASAGWFLASAALVGAAGPVAAHAFNILAPSAAIRLFALTRTLARYAERVLGHDAVLAHSAHLRPALFRALARRRDRDLIASGDLDARLMRDVEALEAEIVQVRAPAFAAFGALTAIIVALAFVGWKAALAAALGFVAIGWCAPAIARRLAKPHAAALVQQRALLRAVSVALEAGLAEIRAFGAERQALKEVDALVADIAASERSVARAAAFSGALGTLAGVGAILLMLAAAQSGGDVAAGVAAILGALATYELAAPLGEAGARAHGRKAAIARLAPLLVQPDAAPIPAAAPAPPWDIEVRDFALRTPNGAPLSAPVSFRVDPGQIAVIVGRSGVGKSSLLRVLLGWEPPAHGVVTIGGRFPAERDDLAALAAYAPQTIDLLPGSVRENLQLAAPEAGEDEMLAALGNACIDAAVRAAGGLDADIDVLGEGFSGGESRRLALARVFASQRPIIVLDEPTEGLDAETEQMLMESIKRYVAAAPMRVAVIVTHRSTLRALANVTVDFDATP